MYHTESEWEKLETVLHSQYQINFHFPEEFAAHSYRYFDVETSAFALKDLLRHDRCVRHERYEQKLLVLAIIQQQYIDPLF